MKILALERESPGITPADTAPFLAEEARRVWEMMQGGDVREIYFREDENKAVILLEAPGVAEAQAMLAQLPLVRNGLIGFEIIGLRPYPGLSRLFKD